jgi:hypothetical protein
MTGFNSNRRTCRIRLIISKLSLNPCKTKIPGWMHCLIQQTVIKPYSEKKLSDQRVNLRIPQKMVVLVAQTRPFSPTRKNLSLSMMKKTLRLTQ